MESVSVEHEDGTVDTAAVKVEGFAPLLRGPLWRLELVSHDVVGRRFLALVARDGRAQ